MLKKVTNYLASLLSVESELNKPDHNAAIASLLCAVSYANHQIEQVEHVAIKNSLTLQLGIEKTEVDALIEVAKQDMLKSTSIFDFTSLLTDLSHDARIGVIEMMWFVAYADGHLGEIEEAIIRRVAGLLYVPHSEFIRTKLRVLAELS